MIPVKIISSSDLEENGGVYLVKKGVAAVPVHGFTVQGNKAVSSKAIPVYVVSDAEFNAGDFVKGRGQPVKVGNIDDLGFVGVVEGREAIPVYAVNDWPPSDDVPIPNPSEVIPGLNKWYVGDLGITVTGSGVSSWENQGDDGVNLVQATDADRPAVDVAVQNGRDGVRFDAANTEDIDFSSAPTLTDFYYCIAVLWRYYAADGQAILGASNTDYVIINPNGNFILRAANGTIPDIAPEGSVLPGLRIVEVWRESDSVYVRVDGIDFDESATQVSNLTLAGIGRRTTITDFLNSTILEVIGPIGIIPTDGQRVSIRAWLNSQWVIYNNTAPITVPGIIHWLQSKDLPGDGVNIDVENIWPDSSGVSATWGLRHAFETSSFPVVAPQGGVKYASVGSGQNLRLLFHRWDIGSGEFYVAVVAQLLTATSTQMTLYGSHGGVIGVDANDAIYVHLGGVAANRVITINGAITRGDMSLIEVYRSGNNFHCLVNGIDATLGTPYNPVTSGDTDGFAPFNLLRAGDGVDNFEGLLGDVLAVGELPSEAERLTIRSYLISHHDI